MNIKIRLLLGLLVLAFHGHAQDFAGTYELNLETDNGLLPYEVQLVTAEDGTIFGGISALSDTMHYDMPLQLIRQTRDSLYFNIWGKVRIKVNRNQKPMQGLARITKDGRIYPITLRQQSSRVSEGWIAAQKLTPIDLGMEEVSWPTPASGKNLYFTHNRKIWLAKWSPVGYQTHLLRYDTASYHFFSIGLSPDEKTLLAHGVPRKEKMPEIGGGDIYELHLSDALTVDSVQLLPRPVNSGTYDIFPAYTANGALLLTSYGKLGEADSSGRADLYTARLEGDKYKVAPLAGSINTADSEAGAFMDRAGRFVLFHRNSKRPPRYGDKIFISHRQPNGWSDPEPLSAIVNTARGGWSPRISRDGRYLYFNSSFRGQRHIYRVRTSEIPALARYFPTPQPVDGTYKAKASDHKVYDIQLVTAEDEVVYGTLVRDTDTSFYHAPVYVDHYATDSLHLVSWYGDRNLSFRYAKGTWHGSGAPEGDSVDLSLKKISEAVQADLKASARLRPISMPTRSPAFTSHKQDGRMYVIGWASGNIYLIEEQEGRWKKTPVPYDRERYRLSSLGLSPDERTLVAHGRQVGQDAPSTSSLYFLHLGNDTVINSIELLPSTVNTPSYDNFPSFTADGAIVFSSWGNASGTAKSGKGDLYLAKRTGSSYETVPFSDFLNTSITDAGPFVSSNGQIVLFHRSSVDPPMKDKVYWSQKLQGEWTEAKPLPAPINVQHSGQYGARLDARENYLYWTSHHRGAGGLYRLPLEALPLLNE